MTAPTATLSDRLDELGRRDKRQWQAGYLIAISTMLHQHGCTVTAEDAIRDSGITLADAKAIGLDGFDMKVLRPIFANISRHDRYEQSRRALATLQGGEG